MTRSSTPYGIHGITLSRIIGNVFKIIKGIFDFFIAILKGDWAGAWDAIKSIVAAVWDTILAVIRFAWERLKTIFNVAIIMITAWSVG